MRVAFDIGGVLSKYPSHFRKMVDLFLGSGVEVFVITDMQEREEILETLALNGFGSIPPDNVRAADYATHGEGCKAEVLRELKVDVFFDDFLGYLVLPDDTIRCLMLPDPFKPYWTDTWKMPKGSPEFGRRFYKK